MMLMIFAVGWLGMALYFAITDNLPAGFASLGAAMATIEWHKATHP